MVVSPKCAAATVPDPGDDIPYHAYKRIATLTSVQQYATII